MIHAQQYKLADLIKGLEVTVKGNAQCVIRGLASIQQAQPGHLTFLANPLYRKYLATTQASAVILTEADAAGCLSNVIISANPSYTYAKIAAFFEDTKTEIIRGIHSTSVIAEDCHIDP